MESSVATNAAGINTASLVISDEGNGGARGNMTKLGTKNTASQRESKETAGVKHVAMTRSMNLDKRSNRNRLTTPSIRSMAASGAGKENCRAASDLPT